MTGRRSHHVVNQRIDQSELKEHVQAHGGRSGGVGAGNGDIVVARGRDGRQRDLKRERHRSRVRRAGQAIQLDGAQSERELKEEAKQKESTRWWSTRHVNQEGRGE